MFYQKMKQNKLVKISLITSLLGVLILVFLSNNLEPKLVPIKEIKIGDMDNFVKISGVIEKIEDKVTVKTFEVNDDTGSIDVVVFEENIPPLSKGMHIEVIGKVSEFNNELQVNAERIILR